MELKVPQDIIVLAKLLKKVGEIFIVGGFVRNAILGISGTDIDLASAITPDTLKEVLKNSYFKVKDKSKQLGTVLITTPEGETFEHSTFRTEKYDGGKHCPYEVNFVTDLREDAKRRDFTINSIYYNVLSEEIVDIYSGVFDLEQKRIRTIETPEFVFENDGVRILRMIRFACELNFSIEKKTYIAALKMSYRLKDITGGRKLNELELILNSGNRYPISKKKGCLKGLDLFNKFKIWPQFYVPVGKIKYKMTKKVSDEDILIGVLIDIVDSVDPDCISYYLRFLLGNSGLMMPNKKAEILINVISGYYDALNKLNNKEYFFKYFLTFDSIGRVLSLKSRVRFMKYQFFYRYIINHKLAIQIKDLKINGDDLKKNFPKLEEKKFSIILKELLNKVFVGEINNEKDDLLKEVSENVKYY